MAGRDGGTRKLANHFQRPAGIFLIRASRLETVGRAPLPHWLANPYTWLRHKTFPPVLSKSRQSKRPAFLRPEGAAGLACRCARPPTFGLELATPSGWLLRKPKPRRARSLFNECACVPRAQSEIKISILLKSIVLSSGERGGSSEARQHGGNYFFEI